MAKNARINFFVHTLYLKYIQKCIYYDFSIYQNISMYDDFLKWTDIKQDIRNIAHLPPMYKESEVWWCSIGINI
jgi:hypothetical protein